MNAGGIWKGDVLVADLEELETMDASEMYSRRLNAKEVIFPKENGKFVFPVTDGRIKFAGGDKELRTFTLIRDHPIRGESHIDFLGESEGSLPPPHQDSLLDAGEAINDFWSMSGSFIYRHHVQTLLAERRIRSGDRGPRGGVGVVGSHRSTSRSPTSSVDRATRSL